MKLFQPEIYSQRRAALKNNISSGLLLFLGNNESPMNYKDNTYRFRQDSSFLYFFGLNEPGYIAIIDLDNNKEIIFGDDFTMDQIIWVGNQQSMDSKCAAVGIAEHLPTLEFESFLKNALNQNQQIHFLPPYRDEHKIKLSNWLNIPIGAVSSNFSLNFVNAIIDLRSIKSAEEIAEMTEAVNISGEMHLAAMKTIAAGKYEYEIVSKIYGKAKEHNAYLAYPAICSVNGQTLHNHYHGNKLQAGQLFLNDSGAENEMCYAGDITRTIPVSGKFTSKQKEIYNTVLEMENTVIESLKPGITYKSMHLLANRILLTNLKQLGLLRGDIETMLELGVGGLFMPHGLGHMIGLDVHDMEDLGEDLVGYDESMERSTQLGLKSLRLAKQLQAGFTITVEPGIYFIPDLIEKWKSEGKFTEFIEFEKLKDYYDFGGIRIEDNVLITNDSYKVLGEPIPKTTAEIEAIMA